MIGMSMHEETATGEFVADLPDVDADAVPSEAHVLELEGYGRYTVVRVEWRSQPKGTGTILLPLVVLTAA